jgi:putative oxidoreductase
MDMISLLKTENKDLALGIIRLITGLIFSLHGAQKLFGWFGGPGPSGFLTYLASMHIPAWLGYVAMIVEFMCGVLMLFGVAAELGALIGIPFMAVAIYLVHWKNGFFAQNGGYEYPLLLLVLCVAIVIGGPGRFALWDVFKAFRI